MQVGIGCEKMIVNNEDNTNVNVTSEKIMDSQFTAYSMLNIT